MPSPSASARHRRHGRSTGGRHTQGRLTAVVAALAAGMGLCWLPALSVEPAAAQTLVAGMAYVTNWGSGTVTPINTETGVAGTPIKVGTEPDAIAVTPNGATAYVANWGSNSVTPINLSTGTAGTAIPVGLRPDAVAILPDGATAYVANFDSASVTPITIATNKAGAAIPTGSAGKELHPDALAVDPSNDAVYATSATSGNAVMISSISNKVGFTIPTGADPFSIAVSPTVRTAYVTNFARSTLTPVNLSTGKAGTAIPLGAGSLPRNVAITPNGEEGFVDELGTESVVPIDLATGTVGTAIPLGTAPEGIAVSPDGTTAYVADSGTNEVTPIDVATGATQTPITVGTAPDAIAFGPGWTSQVGTSGTTVQTALGPAIADYRGLLYAFWTDEVSGNEVMWATYDGSSWTTPQQLSTPGGDALSLVAPSAAAVGSKLWVAWKGEQSGLGDVWVSAYNGTSWTSQTTLSWAKGKVAQSFKSPAVSSYGQVPIVAWANSANAIQTSLGNSNGTWNAPKTVTGASGSPDSPALADSQLNNSLYVGWTTSSSDIDYEVWDPVSGSGSSPAAIGSARTDQTPALASTGEAVYAAWEGTSGNKIYYSGSWPLDTSLGDWTAQETEPQALTDEAPALAVDGYDVILAWKGLSPSLRLFLATATTPY